jgi:hypothetical protein
MSLTKSPRKIEAAFIAQQSGGALHFGEYRFPHEMAEDGSSKTYPRHEAEANARLFTVAPDLLSDIRVVLAGFKTDPGTSDLDDEQPINVWMTLGDYRRMAYRVAVLDRPL